MRRVVGRTFFEASAWFCVWALGLSALGYGLGLSWEWRAGLAVVGAVIALWTMEAFFLLVRAYSGRSREPGKWLARTMWFGVFAVAFAATAKITFGQSNLVTAVAALVGVLAGGVVLYRLGADDRREQREYYNPDDVDGTYLWTHGQTVPEAGSALPTP